MPRRKSTLPPFTTIKLKDQVWGVEFYCQEDLSHVEINAFMADESFKERKNKKNKRPFIKSKWDLKLIKKRWRPPKVQTEEGFDYGEVARELIKMAAPLVGKKRGKQQKQNHLLGLTILQTVAQLYRET